MVDKERWHTLKRFMFIFVFVGVAIGLAFGLLFARPTSDLPHSKKGKHSVIEAIFMIRR
jgi:hypothetical protein